MRKVIRALRKIPLFLLLLLVGAGVSGIAVYGKDTLYAGEEWDWKTEPYFVVVLRGIQEGIYPWEPAGAAEEAEVQDAALQALLEQAQQAAQSNTGQAQQDGSGEAGGQSGAGTDDVANGASGGDVSGNTAAGLDVSGNDVSDNDVS
ncbi:MAG: hypothetical protein Q4C60_11605, partial [Eubacteriales bacterium]|nr:hypothetical protein [Eubacteriales bacterium]